MIGLADRSMILHGNLIAIDFPVVKFDSTLMVEQLDQPKHHSCPTLRVVSVHTLVHPQDQGNNNANNSGSWAHVS